MSISNKLPELIGVGGTFASGKDSLAQELIKNYGFTHVSTGDMVRAEAMKRYGNIERPTLKITATELRQEFGGGAMVERALESPRPLVITGIRSLGEAKALKNAGGILVFVDADPKVRYERMRSRRRDNETTVSFDEFMAEEEKEMRVGDTDADFSIRAIGEMANLHLDNSGTYDEFAATAIEKLNNH